MKRSIYLFLAAVSFLGTVMPLAAATRPHYGGTLRVQLKEAVNSIDPSDDKDPSEAKTKIASLIFDRLTRIAADGTVQPQLASSWTSDSDHRIWHFRLRAGVKFHDDSPFLAITVISTLSTNPRWRAKIGNAPDTIVVECDVPTPDLPALVAAAKYSVVLHNADGTVLGTGPFQIAEWQPGHRLLLSANSEYFNGRPYLDAVEIQMGNSIREQLVDLRLDRDDVVEIGVDQVKRLTQASQRISSSAPSMLLALVFRKVVAPSDHLATPDGSKVWSKKSPVEDVRVRELLARSINREAINNVILQKQGNPSSALLPQWLSGYSFLLNAPPDPQRIKDLRADVKVVPNIYLAYDSADPVSKAVAERISVNARDGGLTVQPYGEKNLGTPNADVILKAINLESTNAAQALAHIAVATNLDDSIVSASTPEQRFAAEKALLADYKVVPVVYVPQSVWISSKTKNWILEPNGGWRIEQVWLESSR